MAEMISMRKAYGEALVALGRANEDVVALSADVANSDHSYMFAEAFPDRFFNVGIAEQSLVDVAVGLANGGKIPFANTFAFLFSTRALEMVRTHLCYGRSNVKLMGAYGGLSDSFDGPTHHSYVDLAVMRSLPNMTVVVPAEPTAMESFLRQIADWPGPVYCRMNRNALPRLFDASYEPVIGKAYAVREGTDVTIIANGIMLARTLEAADSLDQQGISARVLEMHTIKPLDEDAVVEAARATGAVVTVEEHTILGGLGGAVAELLGDRYPVPVKRVGVNDCFTETGPYDKLLDSYGMSVKDIVSAGKSAVDAKQK